MISSRIGPSFPRGVMDDPAIPAEADAGDAFQGNAPAQLLDDFLPIAADDHGRVRAERQPAFRVFGGVPAAQDGQYPRRHGADLVAHERGIAVPVDREADQVRLRPEKIPRAARFLAQVHKVQAAGKRLDDGCDVLQPQRRNEPDAPLVAAVGIDAENVFESRLSLERQHYQGRPSKVGF